MEAIAVVGLDLAKNVFQVHGVGGDRRQIRRGQMLTFFASLAPCLVGIEACASAHHWGRELMALGHQVRLMPPAYVKAYVKRGKTDAADAEAIAEAVTRPTMRFVAVKSKVQQAALMLHKSRDLMVRQRTMLINAVRGHLGEYGIIATKGAAGVRVILKAIYLQQEQLPELARAAMHCLARQLEALEREIERLEAQIVAWHREDGCGAQPSTGGAAKSFPGARPWMISH
jgi:transposase